MLALIGSEQLYATRLIDGFVANKLATLLGIFKHQVQSVVFSRSHLIGMWSYLTASWKL